MGRFNIDDKVRTGDVSHVPARYRNAEGVVSNHRYRGERITVKFPDGGEHWFYENELTPVASAKSLLRAKYKGIPENLRRDVLRWVEERGRSRVLQTVENRGPMGNAAIRKIAREHNITPEETRRMIQELLIELR